MANISTHLASAHKGWPLCWENCVIIHLNDPPRNLLRDGDFYLCLKCNIKDSVDVIENDNSNHKDSSSSNNSADIGLVLRYSSPNDQLQDIGIEDVRNLFKMSGIYTLKDDGSNLRVVLRHCLLAVEQGVQRLRWDEVVSGSAEYQSPIAAIVDSVVQENSTETNEEDEENGGTVTTPRLELPQSVLDVNYDVLSSGIATLPGSRDSRGGSVVVVHTHLPQWNSADLRCSELARLFMYYYVVPREEIRKKGSTFLIQAKGASELVLNNLLEAFHILEVHIPGSIYIIHILVDSAAQGILLNSPALRPEIGFKLDLVSSQDLLCRFVEKRQLPIELGGYFSYNHEDWITFRMQLEPFLSNCHSAAKFLLAIMREMTSITGMPQTSVDTKKVIERHEQYVRKAFEDARLISLQNEGTAILGLMNKLEPTLGHSQDYRDAMDLVNGVYTEVHECMARLTKLASTRVQRLEQCLQLREFEEQSAKMIAWLRKDGEALIQEHSTVGDNLKALRKQQKEFEKGYFAAMTKLEKCQDLIEEASLLAESESFKEHTGIREVARTLKRHIHHFTSRVEETRERIEDQSQCYHLLDKAYEWALEAMKYVASMKMDTCNTIEGLETLSTSLASYLKNHPPIGGDTFDKMQDLAVRLKNEKLQEQCKVARSRCLETGELLRVRQLTLCKAKDQLIVTQMKKDSEGRKPLVMPETPQMRRRYSHASDSVDNKVWLPKSSSTPVSQQQSLAHIRRRSYAGMPSSQLMQPGSRNSVQMFGVSPPTYRDSIGMNLSEYEEQLFNEGLITEDMSHRVVTSIPRPRSRENLTKDDVDSASISSESTTTSSSSTTVSMNKKDRILKPLRKMIKTHSMPLFTNLGGANSSMSTSASSSSLSPQCVQQMAPIVERRQADSLLEKRQGKSISLITGSSDSLPSLPEEEEPQVTEPRKESWSPVPVNTHLISKPHHSSMSDLRLTEAEIKSRRTLNLVMREMVQTERDYVQSLKYVIQNYIPELERDDVPQALRGKRNLIFGNIEKIYQFHSQYFLQELEQSEGSPFQVCQFFLQHEPQFYLYALYNKNKPKSDALMQDYGSRFFRAKQVELGDRMDLGSYLLKPVQRMGKYALLLKQIIKECPETEPEYQDLKAAEEMVKFQLRHGNDLLAMDAIIGCDVNLPEQGRLLRQESFLVWQGRRKSVRHVFLFEDLILFSKTKRSAFGHDAYIYKSSIKTTDIGMTENVGDSGYRFEIWFRKLNHGDTYVLQAASSDSKNAWVRDISRILWRQAIRNRELRQAEMTSMGIGSKPCIDLKQSEDNISDRLVNISMGNKPRTRNSIAVSSFDHLKNGNKRPHSIISVSSTSSSSSGQSSYQGNMFGTLNVTLYEQGEDDFSKPCRSYTLCSVESGICADMSTESSESTSKRDVERSDSGASVSSYTLQASPTSTMASSSMVTEV
ncbi:pleckstrin homology domain-containing family G member 4B isoform X4 [Lingula anatina]|uniref:Pleckstrin homology domain-containing family G member 4B isoform X3 n=1 Tax=Lingula anatina TaxID=7574 RepID=A0A1S3K2B4_LINAN|nr:pleckstrin homology domain-containing family G member 4B isoform X3 [Lingula anatina]XP_013416411.1 pleckstrin homology domain-containing family G member 4B isoform X4 [Lingula anatina]|eukprot:XP_013416410.1 pleckstrin homology domain-containing family G member 4B isoform X3 [Lingula anatina]